MNTTYRSFAARRRACAVLLATAASVAATTALAAPAASEAEKEQTLAFYTTTLHMKALDDRCRWLGTMDRVALEATIREQLAWLNAHGVDSQIGEARAKLVIEQERAIVCDSPDAHPIWNSVGLMAWQMRSSWLLRSHALLAQPGRPAWFNSLSPVGAARKDLETALAGLRKIGRQEWLEDAKQHFDSQSPGLLAAARCTPAVAGCPIANGAGPDPVYAKTWVDQAEAFAKALARTADKTGLPSAPKTPVIK